jgi:threonyl-tRNA synthetase
MLETSSSVDTQHLELESLRHSTAHIMAEALTRLFPDAQLAFGPTIENGFYYDVKMNHVLIPEDLEKIEAEMRKIIKANVKFEQEDWTREKAIAYFTEKKQVFKLDQINKLQLESYSVYRQGDFIDLCRGPHANYSKKCKHFKLMSISGAYFRGDENNEQLQRIYGTAWKTKAELEEHLHLLEEAKKRDHRRLGQELELFEFHSELSPGAVFWQAKGATLWRILSQKTIDFHLKNGYEEVRTPLVFNKKLWETSGHWQHFKDNMFLIPDVENEDNTMALKPMNCPGHMLMFKSKKRSYRELPLRLHDQSQLHRYERSGTLNGLIRVRSLCQDDAHIFVREEQIEEEATRVLKMIERIYEIFGMSFRCALATRPEKMMGEPKLWDLAENALKKVLDKGKYDYQIHEGDGAFYGPKIDFYIKDSLKREHQCSTLQLDFQLPRNFKLKYTSKNNEDRIPIVIHRALYGSFERFIGILIEHYGGAFPMWLAPLQLRLIPVAEKHVAWAEKVLERFRERSLRADLDAANETLGAKLRRGKMSKIPYLIVIGDREQESQSLAWNRYGGNEKGNASFEEFLDMTRQERELIY